jgi:hypothetical protein
MKKIIFIINLLLLGFLGQAQNESVNNVAEEVEVNIPTRVKIIMKNGSILYADFISYEPEVGLLVQINGNNVVFEDKNIKKFKTLKPTKLSSNKFHTPLKTKRVYFRTNIGMLSNTNGNGTSMNISALYQFNSYFSAGIGMGIDNYYFNVQHNIFPVFTEIKAYAMDKKSTPFVSLKTGYSFNRAHEDSGQLVARGGVLINPTFGYRFGSEGIMFDIYSGLRFQKAYYEKVNWAYSIQEITWRRVELGMALSF